MDPAMGYKRLKPDEKLKTLPAKYTANALGWNLDWRSPIALRLSAEVLMLAQDLGGWSSLSRQKQILVERTAYLRLKTAEYETADMQGKPTPFDGGTYSNKANVLLGHLKALGLERLARPARTLHQVMRGEPAEGA
jgi:hypothetical protein